MVLISPCLSRVMELAPNGVAAGDPRLCSAETGAALAEKLIELGARASRSLCGSRCSLMQNLWDVKEEGTRWTFSKLEHFRAVQIKERHPRRRACIPDPTGFEPVSRSLE